MLDTAFEALKTYDWGSDMSVLAPIEDAATKTASDSAIRADLEKRLIAALEGPLSRDAQDYACRKLAPVGSAACVPVLSGLLLKEETSHMARFALERNPSVEAGRALREALPKVTGNVRIGIISSLGSRRDSESIKSLSGLLNDSVQTVAKAAAMALGTIGTVESGSALQTALTSTNAAHLAFITDALLSCAESLLAGNRQSDANSIYKLLSHENRPRLVRLAATRGLLACASKNA